MFLVSVHQSSKIVVFSDGRIDVVGVFFTLAPNGCGQADVAGFKVRKFHFNCMLIRIPDDRGECPPAIALARC